MSLQDDTLRKILDLERRLDDLVRPELTFNTIEWDYLCYVDEKTQNTVGGDFTSGAWRTRVLNVERADDGGHGSLSSNQITLQVGTYIIQASAPAYAVNRHQTRLYNITDAAATLSGTSEYAGSTDAVYNRSFIAGQFTIDAAKVFELQHRCETTVATRGFGVEANFQTEVYSIVELWKIT